MSFCSIPLSSSHKQSPGILCMGRVRMELGCNHRRKSGLLSTRSLARSLAGEVLLHEQVLIFQPVLEVIAVSLSR
jgi:hypothetical protein